MTERGHGFSTADHRRVSRVVREYERGRLGPGAAPATSPDPRGLVRVMLLGDLIGVDISLPPPIRGDFPTDRRTVQACVTQPIEATHYLVRCVASVQDLVARTWQLTVTSPAGVSTLTAAIAETATAADVQTALNATGCSPCVVIGAGMYLVGPDEEQVAWPERQWHIVWPDKGWSLSTAREIAPGIIEYLVAPGEVPIALMPTRFAPSPFCEPVNTVFGRSFAAPTPGTFALCQPLHGVGLVVVDCECWSYVD